MNTLDKLQRQQHSNLRLQRDIIAKQVSQGQDRIKMINKEELVTRL